MSRSGKPSYAKGADRHESRVRRSAVALHVIVTAALLVGATNFRANVARASVAVQQRSDTVVRMAGAPLHKGVAKLVEELSIGNESGPDPYILGRVSEIGVGPDTSVYIFDSSVSDLRKFDARGKFVRSLGRKGQGPGEYDRISGLMVARDGRVYLRDPSNDRLNVYSKTGEVLETWSNGGSRLYTGEALQVDASGIVYTKARLGSLPTSENGYIRMGAGGKIIDSLAPPHFTFKAEQIQGVIGMRMGSVGGKPDTTLFRGGFALPFAPTPMYTLSPLGYFVTGVPNRYAFELRVPRGQRAARPSLPAGGPGVTPLWSEGQPVISIRMPNTEQVKIGVEEGELRRALTETAQRATEPNWQWTGPSIPQVKPYYKRIEVGLDGRIIIALHTVGERYTPPAPPARAGGPPPPAPKPTYREPAVFDIFEPTGVYVGRVAVPYRHSVFAWWGDHAWGTVTDEDGVQSVKRWRLVW